MANRRTQNTRRQDRRCKSGARIGGTAAVTTAHLYMVQAGLPGGARPSVGANGVAGASSAAGAFAALVNGEPGAASQAFATTPLRVAAAWATPDAPTEAAAQPSNAETALLADRSVAASDAAKAETEETAGAGEEANTEEEMGAEAGAAAAPIAPEYKASIEGLSAVRSPAASTLQVSKNEPANDQTQAAGDPRLGAPILNAANQAEIGAAKAAAGESPASTAPLKPSTQDAASPDKPVEPVEPFRAATKIADAVQTSVPTQTAATKADPQKAASDRPTKAAEFAKADAAAAETPNAKANDAAQAETIAKGADPTPLSAIAERRAAALDRLQRSETLAARRADGQSSAGAQASSRNASPASTERAVEIAGRTEASAQTQTQPTNPQPSPQPGGQTAAQLFRASPLGQGWMTQAANPVNAPAPADAQALEAGLDPSADPLATERLEARAEAHRGQGAAHQAAGQRFSPTAAHALAAHIARKASEGARVFDIRLDPPELGRVDVRLEMRAGEKVSAVLSAERADALAELQRSARDLERALNEAGLDLDEDGLSFEFAGGDPDQTSEDEPAPEPGGPDRFTVTIERGETGRAMLGEPMDLYGFALSARAGLDLRA